MSVPPGRWTYWPTAAVALLGLTGLALAIRLPHLTMVPRFTDESLEVLWSLPIARGQALPLTNYDAYYGSLFNYLVAGSFLLLGPSALTARLVVLVTGLLTVLATFALARAWGGASHLAGLLAGGLLALNPAHVLINSHIAWSNCVTPLFTTLATWLLWWAAEAASPPAGRAAMTARAGGLALTGSGLLWGLALQTHPLVATLLPGAALFALWRGRGWWRTAWPYLALLAFGLGYANLIVHNLSEGFESLTAARRVRQEYFADDDAATSYSSALLAALLLLARMLGGAVDQRTAPWAYLLDLPVLLGSGLALAGVLALSRRRNPLPLLLVASTLLLLPALNPKFRTLISSRYLMPLLPLLLAALAVPLTGALGASRPWLDRRFLLALAAAAALALGPLLPLSRYYERAYASGDTNVRAYALAESAASLGQPGELLVLDESFGAESGGVSELRALRYLLSFQERPTRVLKLTPKRLEEELEAAPSLLVVLSGRQLREFERLGLEPLTALPQRGSDVALLRLRAGPA